MRIKTRRDKRGVIIPEAIYWSRVRRFLSTYASHRTWEVGQDNSDIEILKWLFRSDNKGIIENNKCEKCMFDAPYKWCCKRECGVHAFCKDCNAKSKGYRSDSESC